VAAKSDPANYRAMLVPHESIDAANAAWNKFLDVVEKARKEFRIADVHVLARMHVSTEAGEMATQASSHYGNGMEALAMLAEAYGAERERLLSALERTATGKRSK
jgi:hypothetical protein